MNRNPLNFSVEQLIAIHDESQSFSLLDDAALDDYMLYEASLKQGVIWGSNDKKQVTDTEVF